MPPIPALPDPVPELKILLAREIVEALSGWSEGNASILLGTDCRRVSDLRAGRLKRFSLQKLVRLAATIDRRVELTITWTGRRSLLGKGGEVAGAQHTLRSQSPNTLGSQNERYGSSSVPCEKRMVKARPGKARPSDSWHLLDD